jgi:hypothetical protein
VLKLKIQGARPHLRRDYSEFYELRARANNGEQLHD